MAVGLQEVLAWAHKPKDASPPADIVDAIRYRHRILDALPDALANAALSISTWSDRNAELRARVLCTLVLGELPTNAALLTQLLDAEIRHHQNSLSRYTTLAMACYLNAFGRPLESTPQIWQAKTAGADDTLIVDIQLCVAGAGVQQTLAHFPGPEHAAMREYISACLGKGELDDLEGWRVRTLERLRHDARDILAGSAPTHR